ncbi:NAD(P)H-binding protein [Streptomyces albulus]|nr:NAD(P)H-binding protein [Streptomyces noursei]
MTGASGSVGRVVVEGLLAAGVQVRALTRDPDRVDLPAGAQAVAGDLTQPAGLDAALEGVDRMYLFPVPTAVREVVAAAERAGVRRIVTLSSGAVTAGYDTVHHLPVERAVEAAAVEWTHVRPGEFAMNKVALWGPDVRAERVVRHPAPEAIWCPVHERDIADVAVTALLEDGHHGAAHTVNGPPISLRDQARALAEALGQEVRFEQVTPKTPAGATARRAGSPRPPRTSCSASSITPATPPTRTRWPTSTSPPSARNPPCTTSPAPPRAPSGSGPATTSPTSADRGAVARGGPDPGTGSARAGSWGCQPQGVHGWLTHSFLDGASRAALRSTSN